MEAILEAKSEEFSSLNINFVVTLKHSWSRTLLEVGDIVRIIGVFNHKNKFKLILDDIPIESEQDKSIRGRFIILEPDILIPSTSISTACPCPRVPLLRELFKNSEGNPKYPLTFGNVVHLVFQRILENRQGKLKTLYARLVHRSRPREDT